MIAETSAFLTSALNGEEGLPRIPRRPVRRGGYSRMFRSPAARSVAHRWWSRALRAVGQWTDGPRTGRR